MSSEIISTLSGESFVSSDMTESGDKSSLVGVSRISTDSEPTRKKIFVFFFKLNFRYL